MSRLILLAAGLFAAAASSLAAPLNYDEAIDGDLSGNNFAPTPLAFEPGVNVIAGRMGQPAAGTIDRDFFQFTLEPGWQLVSIDVLAISPPERSFYAIAAGTFIITTSSAQHLSNVLITGPGEILDDLAAGAYDGGLGLDAPLGAGTYTVWLQETLLERDYRMAYTVTPEPNSAVLMLAGTIMFAAAARRRFPVSRA